MEFLTDIQNQVLNASPFVLCIFGTIAVCYMVKLIPAIDNKYIPLLCLLLPAVAYPLLIKPSLEDHQQLTYPIVKYILIGLIAGALAWIVHNKFLRDIIDKRFPSNTETVTENKQ